MLKTRNIFALLFVAVFGVSTSTFTNETLEVWFKDQPQNVFYRVGDIVTFNCTCCTNSSKVSPRVEFRHNALPIPERFSTNQRVSVSEPKYLTNGTSKNQSHGLQLEIKEIRLSEMGVIACLCYDRATEKVILTTEAILMPKNVLSDIKSGTFDIQPVLQLDKPAWNASVLVGAAFSKHNVSIERNGTDVYVSANRTIETFDLGKRDYRFDWNFSLPERVNPRTVKATFLEDTHELLVTGHFYNKLSIEVE